MKNSVLLFAIGIFMAACGGGVKNPKAELELLLKQRTELETKISTLEEEIAKTDTTAGNEKAIEVVAMVLKPQIFKTYIEVQGWVDADENVALSSEMPGVVTKINVQVGDQVNTGEILAETDSRAIQQQLADLQTNYELAKKVFEKQENLWEQKIGTEIQYLQSKTNKESLEKKIAGLQEQLRMSRIISPINGTIDAVKIKIGQAINAGFPAITVINFSNLSVKANVAESYASRIKAGNEVQVLFPDMKDSAISKVHHASRAIDATTRTFAVEAPLDTKKEYRPNMVTKLKINDFRSEKPELVLPVKYIQKGANDSFVMLEENGKVVKKTVTLGREYSGMVQVLAGIKEGDKLITEGYDLVIEGDKVISQK